MAPAFRGQSRPGAARVAHSPRSVVTPAIGHQQSQQDRTERPGNEPVVWEAALDIHGNVHRAGGAPTPLPEHDDPVSDNSSRVSRRAALLAVCGTTALWWLDLFPSDSPEQRAIERVATSVPFQQAHDVVSDAAAVCSSLHSQMSSTMRMLRTGFMNDELFQATCRRRLSSPYIAESLLALEDAIPVVGMELAYAPDVNGIGWFLASVGNPRVDKQRCEKYEGLTLSALQRCRRVQRLANAMETHKFTPAGVELLVQDLKHLSTSLDEILKALPPATA